MRRKANEDGRSMNNWLERLLLKMSDNEKWANEDGKQNEVQSQHTAIRFSK